MTYQLWLSTFVALATALVSASSGPARAATQDASLPKMSVADASVTEGDSGTRTLDFQITLDKPSDKDLTFGIAVFSGTASSGSDFVDRDGLDVTLPAGVTSYTYPVEIHGDTLAEFDETLRVNLYNNEGSFQSWRMEATGTIVNDDGDAQTLYYGRADRAVVIENSLNRFIFVLENDRFRPGDLIGGTLAIEQAPAQGSLRLNDHGTPGDASDDTFEYTPAPDTSGTDRFRYRVCDKAARCFVAEATVVVQPFVFDRLGDGAGRYGFSWSPRSGHASWPGPRPLVDAEFKTTPLIAAVELRPQLPVDPLPASPWDGAGQGTWQTLRTLPAPADGQPMQWQVYVEGKKVTGPYPTREAIMDLYVGLDSNGNGRADAGETGCVTSLEVGHQPHCELTIDQAGTDSVNYWILAHNQASFTQDASVGLYEVPIVEGDRRMHVTGPRKVGAGETGEVIVAWNDALGLPSTRNLAYLRVFSSPGVEQSRVPLRMEYRDSLVRHFPLVDGRPQELRLAAGTFEDRMFIDVPVGASSLTVTTRSSDAVDLFLVRMAPGGADTVEIAPADPAAASHSSVNAGGDESITVSGSALQPGRWHVIPRNASTTAGTFATLVVEARVAGAVAPVRVGSYFNPARPGHGLFLYPAGNQWAGLWYTYFDDGLPTWYYLQGPAPGANGLWSGDIFRSAWDGSRGHLTRVGHATVTPLSATRFNFSFLVDGMAGSEPMQLFGGGGCPSLAGIPVDASSHWFNPARAGTGYSIQLWPNYEFYAAFVYDAQGVPRYLGAELNAFGGAEATLDLDQLDGFCPDCYPLPILRENIGTLRRSFLPDGRIRMQVDAIYIGGVPGTWSVDEIVQPLGGAGTTEGCPP